MGVQNGGWGVQASQPSETNMFAGSIPQMGVGQAKTQAPMGNFGAVPQQPAQQQGFGGWGHPQPVGNPFMV